MLVLKFALEKLQELSFQRIILTFLDGTQGSFWGKVIIAILGIRFSIFSIIQPCTIFNLRSYLICLNESLPHKSGIGSLATNGLHYCQSGNGILSVLS